MVATARIERSCIILHAMACSGVRPLRCIVDFIGNESVPKITINDTISRFFKTAISVLAISNHNSFRMLFDKIASIYLI